MILMCLPCRSGFWWVAFEALGFAGSLGFGFGLDTSV